jgi:hypothetical protein
MVTTFILWLYVHLEGEVRVKVAPGGDEGSIPPTLINWRQRNIGNLISNLQSGPFQPFLMQILHSGTILVLFRS